MLKTGCKHGQRTGPKRGAGHGVAAFFGRKAGQAGTVGARGDIGIAKEPHVAAKRQQGQLPARAVAVNAGPQAGTEADGEDLGMNAAPAPDDVMAEFMHRDDDQQGGDKGQSGPQRAAET